MHDETFIFITIRIYYFVKKKLTKFRNTTLKFLKYFPTELFINCRFKVNMCLNRCDCH